MEIIQAMHISTFAIVHTREILRYVSSEKRGSVSEHYEMGGRHEDGDLGGRIVQSVINCKQSLVACSIEVSELRSKRSNQKSDEKLQADPPRTLRV